MALVCANKREAAHMSSISALHAISPPQEYIPNVTISIDCGCPMQANLPSQPIQPRFASRNEMSLTKIEPTPSITPRIKPVRSAVATAYATRSPYRHIYVLPIPSSRTMVHLPRIPAVCPTMAARTLRNQQRGTCGLTKHCQSSTALH